MYISALGNRSVKWKKIMGDITRFINGHIKGLNTQLAMAINEIMNRTISAGDLGCENWQMLE